MKTFDMTTEEGASKARKVLRTVAAKILANRLVVANQSQLTNVLSPVQPIIPSVQVIPSEPQAPAVIKAENVTLVVKSFSPNITLMPNIELSAQTPEINVEVAAPSVTVEPAKVTVNNEVNVPQQPAPVIHNSIQVPVPEIKEVNVTTPRPKPRSKRITVQGPNGQYTGVVTEES